MKKKSVILKSCLLAVTAAILFSSCVREDSDCVPVTPPVPPLPEDGIYVAGSEENSEHKLVAKLWKSGRSVYNNGTGDVKGITDGTNSAEAYCVVVAGDDIYVAGYEYNDDIKRVVKVWKNGESLYNNGTGSVKGITDGTYDAQVFSLFVSGQDVYVAGTENNGSRNIAKLWKNGISQYDNGTGPVKGITDGTYDAEAKSVFVVGGDVYVAGYEKTGGWDWSVAKLWKNGESVYNNGTGAVKGITEGRSRAQATSVFVAGNDIYVGGWESNVAKLWKNGESMYNKGNGTVKGVTDGTYYAFTQSVFVDECNVYVLGTEINSEDDGVSKLWKNGVSQYNKGTGEVRGITDGTHHSLPYSIFVLDGHVYVAGAELNDSGKEIAKVWKDGVSQYDKESVDVTGITDGSSNACARSVFVVPQ